MIEKIVKTTNLQTVVPLHINKVGKLKLTKKKVS